MRSGVKLVAAVRIDTTEYDKSSKIQSSISAETESNITLQIKTAKSK